MSRVVDFIQITGALGITCLGATASLCELNTVAT